jgi:hypothetical protein
MQAIAEAAANNATSTPPLPLNVTECSGLGRGMRACRTHFPRSTARKLLFVETISPYPPSSATRNQHAVVRHVDAPCACTEYWTYTVRIGVEPFRAVHARPVGLAPPQGCARLSCFRLPTRLSQEDQSSNQLPGFAYPTGEVPLQDRPPCVELPQRSPY